MSASSRRDLPITVAFRVAPDQAALLQEAARPLSPGQFARRMALAAARIEGPKPGRRPLTKVRDAELLRTALCELGHIGGNLNQLTHLANAGHPISEASIHAIRADLAPIRDQLIAALGMGGDDA